VQQAHGVPFHPRRVSSVCERSPALDETPLDDLSASASETASSLGLALSEGEGVPEQYGGYERGQGK